ncbi:MAG: hypothetical protein SFV17_12720 [Candidatus Obscuribacter sp.]|nr:hypothetical protein [Candidatus Obscuribacter sp.]
MYTSSPPRAVRRTVLGIVCSPGSHTTSQLEDWLSCHYSEYAFSCVGIQHESNEAFIKASECFILGSGESLIGLLVAKANLPPGALEEMEQLAKKHQLTLLAV